MGRANAPKWQVMHAVLAQGAALPTHDRLAEVAEVNRRTISNVIRDAAAARLLVGRRPVRFGSGAGLALGLSIGFETLRGALVDANGLMHHELEDPPTPGQLDASPGVLLGRLRVLAARILAEGLADPALWATGPDMTLKLLGVAVAWPCPVDRDKRPGGTSLRDGLWRKRDSGTEKVPTLPERLAAEFGKPFEVHRCHAINDGNADALTVAFDEARARADEPDDQRWRVALVVRIGGGVGAGTMMLAPHARSRLSFIDSRLIEGANGFAGELGHLPIGRKLIAEVNAGHTSGELAPLQYDDWRCSCTRLHHLEAFAGGTALERRLLASGYDLPRDGQRRAAMLRTALDGDIDPLHIHALRDMGRILGRALAGSILMLDPHSITITGSLANEHLVDGIRRERDAWANTINDSVEVRCQSGQRGAYASVRGASLAIIRRMIYRGYLDERPAGLPRTFHFGQADLKQLTVGVRER